MNMDERNKKYRPDEEKHPVTGNLQKDSAVLFDLFEGCSDLKYNEIHLGTEHNISCIVAFIETTVENMLLDETVLGKMLTMLCTMKKEEGYTSLEKAQAFIESRSDKPAQVSPWLYRSTDGNDTDYLIYEVRVV